MDMTEVLQLASSVVVGLGSGWVGARANARAAIRRFDHEKLDRMIPAVREMAAIYRWSGEVHTHERPGEEPPHDRSTAATARFAEYRHELPLNIQHSLDSPRDDDLFSYGEWEQEVAGELNEWINATVQQLHRRRQRRAILFRTGRTERAS